MRAYLGTVQCGGDGKKTGKGGREKRSRFRRGAAQELKLTEEPGENKWDVEVGTYGYIRFTFAERVTAMVPTLLYSST